MREARFARYELHGLAISLAQADGCVHDISPEWIAGSFHRVLTLERSRGSKLGERERCMECLSGQDDSVVRAMHERVVRSLHRIARAQFAPEIPATRAASL